MMLVYMIRTLLFITAYVTTGQGSMMNRCLKVLANDDFHTPCSMLQGNHIKPCLVKTSNDAEKLIGAKAPIPRDKICAAGKVMGEADCILMDVSPDKEQIWQWTEWRGTPTEMIRNFVISVDETNYTCPYEEKYIRPFYRDCQEAYLKGAHTSGVYPLSQDDFPLLKVYCEQELDGGGWTVLQKRQTGQLDFHKSWAEFKKGFGKVSGEHWLGNDYIHLLTKNKDQKVKFRLGSADGEWASADYSLFWVDDESLKYKLHISGYSGAAIPGNSMINSNEQMFTTMDQDNDKLYGSNCAIEFEGAWWHKQCHSANPNGDYGNTKFGFGLNWGTWKGFQHSMVYTAIMVKPN